MPTVRGWAVAILGVATTVLGRLFGSMAVEQLGFGLVVLALISIAVVRFGRHELHVERDVRPHRARVGQPVTVHLRLTNTGRGSAPLVLLEDRLPSGLAGTARFALQGIEPRGRRDASFELTATSRGRYEVGPLHISFVDPFGLARTRARAADRSSFLVYPRIERLAVPRDHGDRRSVASSALRQPTVAQGEDFFTLREYVEGDDLRKIHWASTAKRGRYMIKQEETPWHTRATVLLDDSASVHDGSGRSTSFERAVEAAASVIDLYHRSGYSFRLVVASSSEGPSAKGADHLNRCLDRLATIEVAPEGIDDPTRVRLAELDSATTAEAGLIVVTGTMNPDVAVAVANLKRRFRQITTISFPSHRFGTDTTRSRWDKESRVIQAARMLERSGVRALVLGPDERLSPAWRPVRGAQGKETRWVRKPEPV